MVKVDVKSFKTATIKGDNDKIIVRMVYDEENETVNFEIFDNVEEKMCCFELSSEVAEEMSDIIEDEFDL